VYAALGDPAGLTRMHLHRSRLRWFDGDPAAALAEAQRRSTRRRRPVLRVNAFTSTSGSRSCIN
jgi:hypothetical protein